MLKKICLLCSAFSTASVLACPISDGRDEVWRVARGYSLSHDVPSGNTPPQRISIVMVRESERESRQGDSERLAARVAGLTLSNQQGGVVAGTKEKPKAPVTPADR